MAKLVRWTPTHELARTTNQANATLLRPALDIIENEDNFTLRVNLPGIAPDDVTVEIEDGFLTISGEIANTVADEGERYTYRERRYGAFKRTLRLGDTLDTENAEASFNNGVLDIVLPKLPEAQPKRIKVEAV